jgi:hypothetical protein
MDFGARRSQGLRPLVRPGEAEHPMTGGDQLLDDGRADPAGGTSDKHTHKQSLQVFLETNIDSRAIVVK